MGNLNKIKKIATESFSNGLRLHKDSITLFKQNSIPSSYMLSILAQEEIGKSYLMSEIIFQDTDNTGLVDNEYTKLITKCMTSHQVKQGWFSRQADDFFKYSGKKYPKIIKEISSGKLEENKQNSIYVGVTKSKNKIDLANGKVIIPEKRIKINQAEFQITRVNDFIIEFIEGVRRGILCVDVDGVDGLLTINLAKELETIWSNKSKSTISKLKKYRKFEIDDDC